MNSVDVVLIQSALRQVESALTHLKAAALGPDLEPFKAQLDLICAKGDLKAALVGNVQAKVEG